MNFNLVTNPWIPVRLPDGRAETLGLQDLFQRSTGIADLAVAAHERISLMRLLVCITHAALGAPADPEEWEGWGSDMEDKVCAYLKEWKPQFELFGDGPRFLQKKFNDPKDYPTAQIVYQLSTGNTPTLLDHVGDDPRDFPPGFLARAILVYQNHFVGGSLASKVKGNGPALKALHSFLIGKNLRQTLILNCLDLDTLGPLDLGRPSWEGGGGNSLLGRLAPSPCKLWLVDEGRRILIDQGEMYPEFEESGIREPSTAVIDGKRNGNDTPVLLRASVGKGIWRDLHALTVHSKEERKGPLSFLSHFSAKQDPAVTLWCGELIKAKDAKILDAVESVFTIPWRLFEVAGRIRYQKGVAYAELLHSRLKAAVFIYGKTMKHESALSDLASRHYWTALDQKFTELVELAKLAGTPEDPMGAASFGETSDPWTKIVRHAVRAAYDAACPRSTPRQLQAYAAGLKQLAPKSPRKTPAKS